MTQANFKKNLKQPGTNVSIADHPSFTWQFAPPATRDTEPDFPTFAAIVCDKFHAVQLANAAVAPNVPLKRGRGGESDQSQRISTKKARVGAGRAQAVPRSGDVEKPRVPIPAETGLVESETGRSREMEELLGLDMFRERVFEWFAGAPCVPAGALCLALAELGLDTRDQSTHTSWWTSYVLWAAAFAHQDIM